MPRNDSRADAASRYLLWVQRNYYQVESSRTRLSSALAGMAYTHLTANDWYEQCTLSYLTGQYAVVLGLKEVFGMGSMKIPTSGEITMISVVVCERERTRLSNEVSFARGNALRGGPSSDEIIESCNEAIAAINTRLAEENAHTHSYMDASAREAN